MKKYWQLLKISWSNGLVYRTNLLMWRFRQLILALMSLTIWSVIFSGNQSLFGYSSPQMISYIFLATILQSVILATSLHGLAAEIYQGTISQHFVKPENIFLSFATIEVADKVKNFLFTFGESILLFIIIQPTLVLPTPSSFLLFLILVVIGIFINFFITVLFGTLGFWTPDVWGPKFLFFMIVDFTAGKLFPFDILPQLVQQALMLTPLPYLSFAQTQIFLGKLSISQSLTHIFIGFIWVILLGGLTQLVWKKGMKEYAAAGQ